MISVVRAIPLAGVTFQRQHDYFLYVLGVKEEYCKTANKKKRVYEIKNSQTLNDIIVFAKCLSFMKYFPVL